MHVAEWTVDVRLYLSSYLPGDKTEQLINLTPSTRIAPHYKSDHPEPAATDEVVGYAHEVPYRTIRDGEVIIRG